MADTSSPTEPTPSPAKTGDMIEEFGSVVASMTRLLDRISGLEAFTAAGLHVAEWQALSLIGATPNTSNKAIARKLGVSVQRAQQIGDWLQKRELITVVKSGEDARRKLITITPEGETCLTETRARLSAQLEAEIDRSASVISRTSRLMRSLRNLGVAKKAADATEATTADE